jgi:ATP-dependent helicase/DNAse subunit B
MPANDTRTALWASHSSINEFLQCPRAYYLHYVYKDPQTRHKITIMSPPLSLGQAVHDTLEELSSIPTAERFNTPLSQRFETVWKNVSGKRGGFLNEQEEIRYKERGLSMIKRVVDQPGPLAELAVKIKMDLPFFWLSEADNIILCGRIDWLKYYPDTDSVAIIDFKTSLNEEKADSLQLPIYVLLAQACQKRPVIGARYWYLEHDDQPVEQPLPDLLPIRERIITIAKEMALARKIGRLRCRHSTGCRACKPFEAVLNHEAEYIYTNNRNQDVYILPTPGLDSIDTSEVL